MPATEKKRRRWLWGVLSTVVLFIAGLLWLAGSINATERQLLGIWRGDTEGRNGQTFLRFETFRRMTRVTRTPLWPISEGVFHVDDEREVGRWSVTSDGVRVYFYDRSAGRGWFSGVEEFVSALSSSETENWSLEFAGPDKIRLFGNDYVRVDRMPSPDEALPGNFRFP